MLSGVKFWKPGTEGPASGRWKEDKDTLAEENASAAPYNPYGSYSLEQQRQRLPIFKNRNHILYLAERYQTLVIVGETGSGKSTQIPQYLLESGWADQNYRIGITQPRRVAVTTLASRVAEERGALLGHEIGYTIRFDDCTDSNATRLKFLTDGILVREMMGDPLLSKYSILMLDEAHERSIYSDIIMGLLKKIMRKRPDLHIIIASATLDAETMRDFFNFNDSRFDDKNTATIMTIQGRSYPVEIFYSLNPLPNYIKATVNTVLDIHKLEKPGHILAFLTGQDEVEQAVSLIKNSIRDMAGNHRPWVLPMYSSLPAREQYKIFESTHSRKIIISTNISETSITINNLSYIVDCGFVKIRAFNNKTLTDTLVVVPVSKKSAEQRAGRAGRVRSGKAYRLYTQEEYNKLPVYFVPEMQRSNLTPVILQLKALGINNILRFNFPSPPPAKHVISALQLLYALGALDISGKLVIPLGLRMAEFPLQPMFSKMLLVSGDFGCSKEILIITAMLQVQNIFLTPSDKKNTADQAKRKFAVSEGDHLTLLNVYLAFLKYAKSSKWCRENYLNYTGLIRASEVQKQLKVVLKKFHIPIVSCNGEIDAICRCITAGFFPNAAYLHHSGSYRTVREDVPLMVHPSSVLFSENPSPWVIYNEVLQTGQDYMRDITTIQSSWLYELAPHYYHYGTDREIAAKKPKLE